MAGLATDSEEPVLKSPALKILIKFFGNVCWQVFILAAQLRLKLRPVLLNDLIE
jgi:hypothetical protein